MLVGIWTVHMLVCIWTVDMFVCICMLVWRLTVSDWSCHSREANISLALFQLQTGMTVRNYSGPLLILITIQFLFKVVFFLLMEHSVVSYHCSKETRVFQGTHVVCLNMKVMGEVEVVFVSACLCMWHKVCNIQGNTSQFWAQVWCYLLNKERLNNLWYFQGHVTERRNLFPFPYWHRARKTNCLNTNTSNSFEIAVTFVVILHYITIYNGYCSL